MATKTPMDQSNAKADIDITAAIRRAIMEDKSMSTNAQNCKIITEGGVTTLRGPVNSQSEKDAIEAKAKSVAGVTRVDNQLEVKTK
ncbi:MAG: BON domain-containing protein [Phycisphaerales bacterium]